MRNILQIVGAAGLFLSIAGCLNYDQSVKVKDILKKETIILKSARSNDSVYGISVHGVGHVDGEATVSLMLNGERYKTEKLNGRVRFNWGDDWYSDTAEIRYEPNNVKSGELLIEYSFATLQPRS